MLKLSKLLALFVGLALITFSCQKEKSDLAAEVIPQKVIDQLTHMGFNPDGIERVEAGYRIERDIIITEEFLNSTPDLHFVPSLEQYSTNNLVSTNGNRVITIYAPEGGSKGYSPGMIAGLDEAIRRYNAEGLEISFQRVTSKGGADISMTRLSLIDEASGVLGSAGFPSRGGDPYREIKMSGVLESSYGLNKDEIGTIIAHEMGHCIGFRHTDYFDRSISCGGSTANEGEGRYGANRIPGTPAGATYQAQSFMLSCTDGSDRPFNNDDKTALNFLY